MTLKIAPKKLKFPKDRGRKIEQTKNVEGIRPERQQKASWGLEVLIEMISDPGVFSETNDCSATLAAGKACSISVMFTPSAATKQLGTLTITDNAQGGKQTVRLSGIGK